MGLASKSLILALLVLAMLGPTFLLVSSRAASQEPTSALRIGVLGGYDTFNPFIARSGGSLAIVSLVYEPLVKLDGEGRIVPWLADFEVDGKEITFKLREGAIWHDGSRVKPEDVAFTLSTIVSPNYRQELDRFGLSEMITGIRVVDGEGVAVTTNGDVYAVLARLSKVPIVPRSSFAAGNPLAKDVVPIGSGPFRLVRLTGSVAELEPFAEYRYEGSENVTVLVKSYNDVIELATAIARGDVDLIHGFPFTPSELSIISTGDVTTVTKAGRQLAIVAFNLKSAPTSDIALRRAVYELIDVRRLLGERTGMEPVGLDLISSKHSWSSRVWAQQKSSNLSAATSFLSRANYSRSVDGAWLTPEGQPVKLRVLVLRDGSSVEMIGENIVGVLRSFGFDVSVSYAGPLEVSEAIAKGSYNIYVTSIDYPDVLDEAYRAVITELLYPLGYDARVIEVMVQTLSATADHNARLKIIGNIRSLLERDVPFVPLVASTVLTAFRNDRISGINPWDPASIESLLRAKVVERIIVGERLTMTVTVMRVQTVTESTTIVRVVEKPVESAPDWVFMIASTLAAMMTGAVIFIVFMAFRGGRGWAGRRGSSEEML